MSEVRRSPNGEVEDAEAAVMRRLRPLYDEVVQAAAPTLDVGLVHRAFDPGALTGTPDAALDALQAAEELARRVQDARDRALIALRRGGMTWTELGRRLGVSRSVAKSR